MAISLAALLLFATMLTAIVQNRLGDLIVNQVIGFRGGEGGGGFVAGAMTPDELAEQIVLEGAVLLRNEVPSRGQADGSSVVVAGATNPVLPLTRGSNPTVAVLGWGATSWVPGGNGSGSVSRRVGPGFQGGDPNQGNGTVANPGFGVDGSNDFYAEVGIVNVPATNTLGALELAGITPFQPLLDFYMGYGSRPHHITNGGRTVGPGRRPNLAGHNQPVRGLAGGFSGALRYYDFQFYALIEPDMQHAAYGLEYRNLLNQAVEANDTAIVVITRIAGESIDAPKVQYKRPLHPHIDQNDFRICDPYRHYLEISTEEEELLRFAGANFNNTIVLINSTNTMELGFLDTIPGLDAALFVGATGIRSASALPRLLWDFSERREIIGGVPIYDDGVPAFNHPDQQDYVTMGDRIPFNTELSGDARYLWPAVSPSGRLSSTFAYDMRTAASWNNAGDSNQHNSAAGWNARMGTSLAAYGPAFNPHAPLEFGQRYFRNVIRGAMPGAPNGVYPVGSGNATSHGIHVANTNFQGAGGYRFEHNGVSYIDFSEGIFVGYKWYETAATMGLWDEFEYGQIPDWFRDSIGTQPDFNLTGARLQDTLDHNAALVERSIAKIPYERVCFRTGNRINPTGIDAVVQFPFGFGLSFTTFSWEVYSITVDEAAATITAPIALTGYQEISVRVRVTNTGYVAGKEVVQVFSNPPWATGGIEKSSANLLAFAKTYEMVEPGEYEYVDLKFSTYELASFDTYNQTGLAPATAADGTGFGGFVLEPGIYNISLRNNSNQIRINNEFNITNGYRFTYDPLNNRENPRDRIHVTTRFSGDIARNRATGGDGVPIADTVRTSEMRNGVAVEQTRMAQMTRSDFEGTFPVLRPSREITADMIYINMFRNSHAENWQTNFWRMHGFESQAAATAHVGTHVVGGTAFTANNVNFDPTLTTAPLTGEPNAQQYLIWRRNYEVATPINLATGAPLEGDELTAWFRNTPARTRTRMGEFAFDLVHNGGNMNADWHEGWDQLTRLMAIGTATPNSPSTSNAGHDASASFLIGTGFLRSADGFALGEKPFPLIGRPRTPALDATNQMNSFRDHINMGGGAQYGGSKGIGWPNATTVAQTFSYSLARQQGWEKGREASVRAVFGMLSPGIHVLRSPLNGRNFEYYSESGHLTGVIAANYIRGLMDMGIYTYIKHMAVYLQESNRNGLYIFLTEQALREIYLVPFRLGKLRYAESGHGSVAIMSGYSRLGAMWEGGSFHLLTTVTRREWGFRGSIMTDWADNGSYMSMDLKIRAGGDKGMGHSYIGRGIMGETFNVSTLLETNEIRYRIRTAARNLQYTWLFAEYVHANSEAFAPVVTPVPAFNWILMIFIMIWVLLALAVAAVIFLYLPEIKKLLGKGGKSATATTNADVSDANTASYADTNNTHNNTASGGESIATDTAASTPPNPDNKMGDGW